MEILRQAARLIGRKNPQYETLTEVNTGLGKVRVWRTAKSLAEASQFDHRAFKAQVRAVTDMSAFPEWQRMLMRLPNVACVAVVNADGDGVSSYPDWH